MLFQIALVQFKPVRENPQRNIRKINQLLHGIKADLIVIPELANSGYLYSNPDSLLPFAEANDGSGNFLSALREISDMAGGVIVSGYAEREKDKIFNSAAAISPLGIIANYRKTHLYADEKLLFAPGDTGFSVFEWLGVKIGMMICFDWIFPEAARTLSLAGAQIITHPANLVMPYCQDAMITRSIENKVFTITANRIGTEKLGTNQLQFTGESQMTSPTGEILYRGPKNKATVHLMSINPENALDKSISPRNDLFSDRRSQHYNL